MVQFLTVMRILPFLLVSALSGCGLPDGNGNNQPAGTNISANATTRTVGTHSADMPPDAFKKIAGAPGDDTILSPQLTNLGPLWTNARVSLDLKYQDGKTFHEDIQRKVKTVAGKYLVFTVQSKFYQQPMNSILTYDEKASAYKIFGLYGDLVTEGIMNFDSENKIYSTSSSYGNGFNELGVGSRSDKMDSERTLVYKDGVLLMTREVKTVPE
jgi:hypothetical protein